MNKEEILRKAQEENKDKLDEREQIVYGKASQIGMLVGGIICVILVVISRYILNIPEVALVAFMLYFSMLGSNKIVLFYYLKNCSHLVYSIICFVFAVAFLLTFILEVVK